VKTNGRVLAFSHDGRRMVTGGWSPRVWDLATGKAVSEVLKHTLVLTDAEFSPDDQRVITASFDGTARIWDTTTGAAITPPLKHNAAVAHVSFSPDGRRVITGGDTTARIWNATTGEPIAPPLPHSAPVSWASFAPDGRRVLTADVDGMARVWDLASDESVLSPLQA